MSKFSWRMAKHNKSLISRQSIVVFLFFPKPLRKKGLTRRAMSCFSYCVNQGFFEPGKMYTLHCYRCSSTYLKNTAYATGKKTSFFHIFATKLRSFHSSPSILFYTVDSKNSFGAKPNIKDWKYSYFIILKIFWENNLLKYI